MNSSYFYIEENKIHLSSFLEENSFGRTDLGKLVSEKGILAGANVVMPNLSPVSVRKKYLLYDNKICTGDESAQCRMCLQKRVESAGYRIVESRGDHAAYNERK